MRFILLLLAFSIQAHAGGAVGNGGDAVYCSDNSASSPYSGWYNLDYLIDKTSDLEFAKDFEAVIGPHDSFDKNILRIMQAFRERGYKVLHQDLKEFYEGLWTNQLAKRYIWKKAPYGTVDVDDEELRQRIPPNCLGAGPKSSLIQAIVRTEKKWEMKVPGKNFQFYIKGADFTYSTEIIAKLPSLQLSFLLFHEWLRNFTSDPELIRDANAVFHSQGWSGVDTDGKLDILNKLRLDRLTDLRNEDRPHKFANDSGEFRREFLQ